MSASQAEFLRLQNSKEHQYLYIPEPVNSNQGIIDKSKLPPVMSAFPKSFVKVLWHTNHPMNLEAHTTRTLPVVESGRDAGKSLKMSTYQISAGESDRKHAMTNRSRYLYSTTIRIPFPRVSVKLDHRDSVRISRSPDAGIYGCRSSNFKVGDISYDEIQDLWIDDWYQWCRTLYTGSQPSTIDRESLDESLLNLRKTEWFSEIEGDIAEYTLPHFYSYSPGSAFPIFMVDKTLKINHEVIYPASIAEYLYRSQISEDGSSWVDVPIKEVMKYLEIEDIETTPTLLVDCYDLSKAEIEELTNPSDDDIGDFTNTIPIQQVVTIYSPNSVEGGITEDIPIVNSDPIVALFVKSRNEEAVNLNCYSNCTNKLDENDPTAISSISSLKIQYGQVNRCTYTHKDMRSNRSLISFPAIPYRVGRYAHAFARRPFDPARLCGTLADSGLQCKLMCQMTGKIVKCQEPEADSSSSAIARLIAKQKNRQAEVSSDEKIVRYRTVVNLLVHREMSFDRRADGEFEITIT